MTITRGLAALAAVLLMAGSAGASSDAEKCQSSELKTSGKYSFCRLKAEAKAVKTATTPDYSKCDDSFAAKFGQADTAGMGQCPAGATQAQVRAYLTQCSDDVAAALGGAALPDCSGDLATCNASLGTCTGNLSTCSGSLATCSSDLSTANTNLTTCNGNLGTCTSDLSTASANLTSCNGFLSTCNGNLGTCNSNLTATTASLTTCSGNLTTCTGNLSTCTGSLSTCNANLGSCTGSLATVNAGTATAGNVLSGKTFSSAAGIGLTGTMPNNGAVSITPGTAAQAIAAGYHNGSGSVAGDPDLVSTNIVAGVAIFGVSGTVYRSQPLRTGQTQCDQGAGTLGVCPGSPLGQDGTTLKGQPRAYGTNGYSIFDASTGLEWEKLNSTPNSIHFYGNLLTWTNAFKKIQVLNGDVAGCIALNNPDPCCSGPGMGSCTPYMFSTDWRLPNVNELHTLVDYGRTNPAIDPIFSSPCPSGCTLPSSSCSCETNAPHWSSTSAQSPNATAAYYVLFSGGTVNTDAKTSTYVVRAVRGGS